MSIHYVFRGFLDKSNCLGSIYHNFGSWKTTIRSVYSATPHKYRKPPHSASRERKKKIDPKVYMKDVVTGVSNILRYTTWDSAQKQLGQLRIKWDSYTVNQVLKTHPPMEKAWMFFNWAFQLKGFKHDRFTYTTMLDIFGEAGRINSMKHVFKQMQEKGINIDVVTYTSLFHWLSKNGEFDEAVKLWGEMKAKGCCPTIVSYTAYMKILFDNNRAQEAAGIYKEMLRSGLSPTCHTYTILMEHLIRSGKCESALAVFGRMHETGVEPDKPTCNILVEQCCKAGEARTIVQILDYMKKKSIVLRYPVYLQARETLKMAGEDDMLLQQVNPHISIEVLDENEMVELQHATTDRNSIIDMGLVTEFLRKKNLAAIDILFSGIMHHNTLLDPEIVSKIIEANCSYGRLDAALLAFDYSNNMCIPVEQTAYLSLIGVLIRANKFSKVLEIVKQLVKIELFLEPELASGLIYRLGESGELDIAVELFGSLPKKKKSTTVYTALINACLSAGDPDKGIEILKSMKNKGVHVARGTYNVAIRGLAMCGKLDESKLLQKKRKSLHLSPENVCEAVLIEEKICDALFPGGYMV